MGIYSTELPVHGVSPEEPFYLRSNYTSNSNPCGADIWAHDVPAKVLLPSETVEVIEAAYGSLFSESAESSLRASAPEFQFSVAAQNQNVDIPGDTLSWDLQPNLNSEVSSAECRWHNSAKAMGTISEDGHVFTKVETRGKRSILNNRGTPVELSPICMVFDASLRRGGFHQFHYQILDGELGAADGAGFVFDKQVRRNNIQRIRSVFLNQRGRICIRNNGQVTKLGGQLPPLSVGMCLELLIDLDNQWLRFSVYNGGGRLEGTGEVSLEGRFGLEDAATSTSRSGFFCAVVTKDVCISIA